MTHNHLTSHHITSHNHKSTSPHLHLTSHTTYHDTQSPHLTSPHHTSPHLTSTSPPPHLTHSHTKTHNHLTSPHIHLTSTSPHSPTITQKGVTVPSIREGLSFFEGGAHVLSFIQGGIPIYHNVPIDAPKYLYISLYSPHRRLYIITLCCL